MVTLGFNDYRIKAIKKYGHTMFLNLLQLIKERN